MISQTFVIMLAVNAGWVAARQIRHGNRRQGWTWALIVTYWVTLTIKNICDFMGV